MPDRQYTILRWISLLYRYGQMYIGEQLKDTDIGKGQYIFLNALYKGDGLSQEELSHDLKIDKGTTAKALKKLEAQGYIVRQVRDEDKRSYRIFLTEKALQIKDEVRQVLINWRHIVTDGLTEKEKHAALELLEKMGNNAVAYFDMKNKEGKAHADNS